MTTPVQHEVDARGSMRRASLSAHVVLAAAGNPPERTRQSVSVNDNSSPPAEPSNGDKKEPHPALTERHGFFFFRDDFELSKEPGVDEAIVKYLPEVERAFTNDWPLHPNLISERSLSQLIEHSYNLDFRVNEMKRIRSILRIDKDVFDYIDSLVDDVMLGNLKLFVSKRKEYLRRLTGYTCLIAAIVLFVGYPWLGWQLGGSVYNIPFAFAAGFSAFIALCGWGIWGLEIQRGFHHVKQNYEEAVRDAAGLVALNLADKGRNVERLMQALKNRLDTLSSPDMDRVLNAPKFIKVLLWCPERMGLIENYYRAKMDQFMVYSAIAGLDGKAFVNGLLYNRLIFIFAFTLVLAMIPATPLKSGPTDPAHGGSGVTFQSKVDSDVWDDTQQHAAEAATHPQPEVGPVHSPQTAAVPGKFVRALSNSLAPVGVVGAIALAWLGWVSRSLVPAEIRVQQRVIVFQALLFLVLGALAGSTAVATASDVAWLLNHVKLNGYVWNEAQVEYAVLGFSASWALSSFAFAFTLMVVRDAHYSSNVLDAVKRKMDASRWTRYSDLRIDERMAEVFEALFQAWYNESRKGLFSSPGGAGKRAD